MKNLKIEFSLNYADEFDMEATGVISSKDATVYNKKLKTLADLGVPICISFGSNQQSDFEASGLGFEGEETAEPESQNSFLCSILSSIDCVYSEVEDFGLSKLRENNAARLKESIAMMRKVLNIQKKSNIG